MKKFAKLNLDHDLAEQLFEDEKVGPCKPGCAIWKLLGRGNNPLALPIPETVVVGPNNHVKLLSNDPIKGFIVQEDIRFDNQSDRDDFVAKCLDKFVTNSKPILSEPPEPLYARFVAVQKKPALKAPRIYITQQSDFLIPIALQAQVLEVAENNLQQCIIQKFIKSRGRRPGIYRLFWRRASNETGAAEGWNITTLSEEFRQPDMITLEKQKTTSDEAEENEVDEITFKRQTTKFIATYLRAGALQLEQELPKDPLSEQINKLTAEVQNIKFKPSSAPLVRQAMRKASFSAASVHADSVDRPDSPDKTFLTASMLGGAPALIASPRTGPPTASALTNAAAAAAAATVTNFTAATGVATAAGSPSGAGLQGTTSATAAASSSSSPHSPLTRGSTLRRMPTMRRQESTVSVGEALKNSNMDFTQFPEGVGRTEKTSEDYFTQHTAKEIDDLFLRGMTSRLYMSSGDRTKALLINAKAISSAGSSVSASITTNDGELSEEKCKRLSATRVSSAALERPISLIAQLAHWMEVSLRDLYNLQVFISEAVVDFIKDDQGRWWFINLKSFKLTEDSLPKVQAWHAIYVQRKPEHLVLKHRPLSAKERKAKHEAEAGVMCTLCGVYYMLHSTVQLPESMAESHPSTPDPITHVPAYGYQMALQAARLVVPLLQQYGVPPTLFTKALLKINDLEDINSRSVKQLLHDPATASVLLHKDSGGDVVMCCYRCFGIYSRFSVIHDRIHYLNGLMGISDAQYWESKDEKFLRGGGVGGGTAASMAMSLTRTMDASKSQASGGGTGRRPRSAVGRSPARPLTAASGSVDWGRGGEAARGLGPSWSSASPGRQPTSTPAIQGMHGDHLPPPSSSSSSAQMQKDLKALAELVQLAKERPPTAPGAAEMPSKKQSAPLPGSQRPFSASSMQSPHRLPPSALPGASHPPPGKHCSYHSIPYGVMHWRMLIMFHYAILEDADKLNKWIDAACTSPSSSSSSSLPVAEGGPRDKELSLPRYFAIQYSLGQQTVHVPFVVQHKRLPGGEASDLSQYILRKQQQQQQQQQQRRRQQRQQQQQQGRLESSEQDKRRGKRKGKKSPIEIFKKQQIIPIQESRLHCLCSKTADMVDYVKDLLVSCRVFSLQETAASPTAPPASSLPPSSSTNKRLLHVQEEGCFSLFTNKLKVHKGSQALLDGLEKQDMLLSLSTASLGTISVKVSVAIVRDDVLPANMSAVETFLVEAGTVYHPPASYVPSGLTLPEAWLSMMLDTKSVAAARRSERKAMQLRGEGGEMGGEASTSESELSAVGEDDNKIDENGHDEGDDDDSPGEDGRERDTRSGESNSSSDSEDSSINPTKDTDDNLIERMLDRQLHKEKEARKEILIQRQMAEERQNRIKEQLQNDRMARMAGGQALSSSQRLIAPSDKKHWTLLNHTISATRKMSNTVLALRAQGGAQGEDSGVAENIASDVPGDSVRPAISATKRGEERTAAAGAALVSRQSTPSHGETAPPNLGGGGGVSAPDGVEEVSSPPVLSPEDKSKRRSRVMGQLARLLREKASETDDSPALAPAPVLVSAPPSPAPPSNSTLSRPSSQGEIAMAESLAASAKARRQRNYSVVANHMLKFTQFQSHAYSPALQQHYEGIEAFLRVFEERMIEMESTLVRPDSRVETGDDFDHRQTYLADIMAEHGLDSRAVLSELSSLVHIIQEEFDDYDALMRAHVTAQVVAASHSPYGSGNDLIAMGDNATVATNTTAGNNAHGHPPSSSSALLGIGEEEGSGVFPASQTGGGVHTGTGSAAAGGAGEGRGQGPSLSFFTVARVMVKHSDVQNRLTRAAEEGGGTGASPANAEVEHSTSVPSFSRRSIASVGHRASIKDLMLLRGPTSTRKGSVVSTRGSVSVPNEVDMRKEAHQQVVAGRNADSLLTDAEIFYVSSTLIDAMTLTLRQLTIMEYLPSRITWQMLKPLIIESLPTFLMER